jgi:hypothetical protein
MAEDKRQNEIIRIQKKRNNFVMLDKGFLEDDRLSFKAKGLLAYLLSKPDNWKVIVKDLVNHAKDGKKAVYSGLKELKEHGYYKKVPIRDESGRRISHWESIIFECPQDQPEPNQNKNKDYLVTQKGEVVIITANSTSSLLTPFVHIDNVQIQNDDIQNGQRNSNYINDNYYNDIQSSQSQTEKKGKTDMTLTNDNDMTANVIESISRKEKASAIKLIRPYQQAEATKFNQDHYSTYREIIQ